MSSAQSSTGVVGMLMRVLAPDKPLRVLIAGGSKCGKSTFARKVCLRMGGSISLKDRETLKYAIYDEFLSFVNQNRAELHHTSRSVQDAEQNVPFFWSRLSLQQMNDWDAPTRAALTDILKEPLVGEAMKAQLPEHSLLRKSSWADIFSQDWFPHDADVVQCHIPGPDVERISCDARIMFTEVNMQALGLDHVKNMAKEHDLVVFVVKISTHQFGESKISMLLSNFEELFVSLRAQKQFAHLIFNDFTPTREIMVEDVRLRKDSLGLWSERMSAEANVIAETLCLLNSSWVNRVLQTWEEISPQQLLYTG